jgi:hypothetical protein
MGAACGGAVSLGLEECEEPDDDDPFAAVPPATVVPSLARADPLVAAKTTKLKTTAQDARPRKSRPLSLACGVS